MSDQRFPHLVIRQLALPPVRDLDRATDLIADYLHGHAHISDPGLAVSLATGLLDVHLTVHAENRDAAETIADQILRDALVRAVLDATAEAVAAEAIQDAQRSAAGRAAETETRST